MRPAESVDQIPRGGQGAPGNAIAELETLDHEVPVAALAHLHHIHGELTELRGHGGQFRFSPDPTVIRSELVPVHVVQVHEVAFSAGRALLSTRLAVEFRGLEQVGIGLAEFRRQSPAGVQGTQSPSALEGVVDHQAREGRVGDRFGRGKRVSRRGARPTWLSFDDRTSHGGASGGGHEVIVIDLSPHLRSTEMA